MTADRYKENPMEGKMVRFVENELEEMNGDGVRGHLEITGESLYHVSIYEKYIKRCLDICFSLSSLLLLAPLFLVLSLAVCLDDPGPVFFTQYRIGLYKKYFKLHKFRTMKTGTPHETPTHMLRDPEAYITRVGRFLRRTSMDELPQLLDILSGHMSLIGPRPALWNQDVLTAERDRYGANDVRPGLTGWAQIHGRDTITLAKKACLDGAYAAVLGCGGWTAFAFDCKCFLRTVRCIFKADGLLEGGTGSLSEERL